MAEVKVKITAQNEVRTGLQQALQETQKFSQEAKRAVSQTMTINPFAGDDRLGPLRELQQQARALREQARAPVEPAPLSPVGGDQFASTSARGASAIRGLAADLANATSAGDVFQAVISRISTAFGGLIAASAGFAVGSLIRRSLEDAAAGLNDLIDRGEQLSQTLSTLSAPTTTFEQFSSTLNSVRSQIEGLQKATEDYKSSFSNIAADFATQQAGIGETIGQRLFAGTGQIAGRIADRILGGQGQLFNQADATEQQKLDEARLSIRAGITRQIANEIALNKQATEEGRKQLFAEQQRFAEREKIQSLLQKPGASPEEVGSALRDFDRLPGLEAQRAAQDREREFAAQAAKQRAINEDNRRSLEERLAREKQGLADLEQFGGADIDVQREQTTARIAELEKQIATERDRAASTAQREAEQREQAIKRDQSGLSQLSRSIQTPEERRASLETEQAALAERAESLAPEDFVGRADVISEAQRIAGELRGLDQGPQGSLGASSLQRIGFASNEFFDTRRKEDPAKETKRAADFVKQIIDILKKGEPLVLPASS